MSLRRRKNPSYGEPITLAIITLLTSGTALTSKILGDKAKKGEQRREMLLQRQQMMLQQQQGAIDVQKAQLDAQAAAPLSRAITLGAGFLAMTGITLGVLWYLGKDSGEEEEDEEAE